MASAPNKYPATEEKTTLTESRSLVISVKFLIMDCVTGCDCVTDKLFFLGWAKIRFLCFFRNIISTILCFYFSIFSILTPF